MRSVSILNYELHLLRFLGGTYRFTGQTEKAIETFKEQHERILKQLKGAEFISNFHLASIYGELGLLKEAQRYLKEALELTPTFRWNGRKNISFSVIQHIPSASWTACKAGLK